jgi:Flp pilus assembly protein TadG
VELVLLTPLLIVVALFVVLCGRLVSAQLDVDAAAHAAARAASLARSPAGAVRDAKLVAGQTLGARSLACRSLTVTVDTRGFRPGGQVDVTVMCVVDLSQLALLAVPGSRAVSAHVVAPIDAYRGM